MGKVFTCMLALYVFLSLRCQPDIPRSDGEGMSVIDCLDQPDLCAFRFGISLIDVRGRSPLWAVPSGGRGLWVEEPSKLGSKPVISECPCMISALRSASSCLP